MSLLNHETILKLKLKNNSKMNQNHKFECIYQKLTTSQSIVRSKNMDYKKCSLKTVIRRAAR
jgi:hypothetical protein